MIGDLKTQEFVNGGEGVRVRGRNVHPSAAPRFLVSIFDRGFELVHRGNSGWHSIMDEHRDVEIARGEQGRDVGQMHLYLIAAFGVLGIVRGDFDRAAVAIETKMMRGFFLLETHVTSPRVLRAA